MSKNAEQSPDSTIKLTNSQIAEASRRTRKTNRESSDTVVQSLKTGANKVVGGLVDFLQSNLLTDLRPQDDHTDEPAIGATHITSRAQEEVVSVIETTPEDELPELERCYEILRKFNEGGQGILSVAKDKCLQRLVALKSLRPELLENAAVRHAFITEALITAQLDHPAIVSIYTLMRDNAGGVHLAMKMIHGQSLRDYLDNTRKLMTHAKTRLPRWVFENRIKEKLEVFQRICAPVAYAHSRNIIHCDLKPENIMLGEFGEVCVMDWGIAKIIRDAAGKSLVDHYAKAIDGTPRYIPPEAYLGRGRDERADIFALGLILFEIVTLSRGYSGKNVSEVIAKVKAGQRAPIKHRFNYPLSRDLRAVIDKATAYDPADRYQSVHEFTDDIQRIIRGEAVEARPENWIARIYRSLNRHSITIFFLTLIGWLIVAIFSGHLLQDKLSNTLIGLNESQHTNVELTLENSRLEYEKRLVKIDDETIRAAINVSSQLVSLSSHLQYMSASAGLLYESGHLPVDAPQLSIIPDTDFDAASSGSGSIAIPGLVYSVAYGGYTSAAVCSYQIPEVTTERTRTAAELKELAPLTSDMRDLLLGSMGEKPIEDFNIQRLSKQMVQEGLLIRSVYMAMEDTGMQIAYPGYGYYLRGYDSRSRQWYINAKNAALNSVNPRPCWSEPYYDTDNKEVVVTCSMPIVDRGQKFCGVLAFDLFFDKFSDMLKEYAKDDIVVEKYLLSADGTVLCHVSNEDADATSSVKDSNELKRLLRNLFAAASHSGYGHREFREPGRIASYHYAHIPSLDLYIVIKTLLPIALVDIEKLPQDLPLPPITESP